MHLDQRALLLLGNALFVVLSEDRLGGNAICADTKWAGLCGDILREDFDAGLRRGVRDR